MSGVSMCRVVYVGGGEGGLVVSKMYLIRVLFFVGDVMFNVRGEHVPGSLGRGLGGYQPGVYVPLKALFLVFNNRELDL